MPPPDCGVRQAHDFAISDPSFRRRADIYAHVPSHDGKADKADLLHDTKAKVIAKGLADLDTVSDAKLWDLTRLDCAAEKATFSVVRYQSISQHHRDPSILQTVNKVRSQL